VSVFIKLLSKLMGDSNEKQLGLLKPLIERVNSKENEMKALSDDVLKARTSEFKTRLANGEGIDRLLPEAFAAVREASVRTTGLRHFDVQLMGGMVLHQGKIAEMATGEGKTLVATLPVYLNALAGKGVHVVTVNDYLARRDSEWMGPIYRFLGLEVGLIQHDMEPPQRKLAYAADITYGTNNEFGFDYLRDNMARSLEHVSQRGMNYAIVDEVDSILIDEARTPLIISGMVEDTVEGFKRGNEVAKRLNSGTDFTIDEKTKNVVLTEIGIKKTEKMLGVSELYDVAHMDLAHQVVQSLRAWHLFGRDTDYVMKEGEVIIVDEFTGRLMFGRRYSDGLHQAIEAKENVAIREESQTLATITFQNYFRMYKKLAGMTGTAKTEEGEFWKIYGLEVMVIPTNRRLFRKNYHDVIYKTEKIKFLKTADEIQECFKVGRPVLVGTRSIEKSEFLSGILKRRGIPHNVLNAKNHQREAEIVANAGQKGAVTISTNMAGRGTDIVLGAGVADLQGLHVIGTERHESRRIDNQLRGRSGRQGDPGSSKFFVSLSDELMRLFGSDRIARIMDRLGIEEDMPIEHRMISNAIESAQKKVEQYHFNLRKQVLEFDDVMNKQREAIYTLRNMILRGENLGQKISEMIVKMTSEIVDLFLNEKVHPDEWDWDGLIKAISDIVQIQGIEEIKKINKKQEARDTLANIFKSALEQKAREIGEENMNELNRHVMLQVIDSAWIDQLHNMDVLRDGIGLRAYGQRDPLIEYKMEGFNMFNDMMKQVREETVSMLLRVRLSAEPERPKIRSVSYGGPVDEGVSPTRGVEKIGRNDPCPCGSGKKYKKCCGVGEK
jgi:preprotein translocase subunit SecA